MDRYTAKPMVGSRPAAMAIRARLASVYDKPLLSALCKRLFDRELDGFDLSSALRDHDDALQDAIDRLSEHPDQMVRDLAHVVNVMHLEICGEADYH